MTIKELREAVEAGLPSPTNWRDFDAIQGENSILAHRAYHHSLDAAVALVKAVLPEWGWAVESPNKACVWHPDTGGVSRDISTANSPARALLIATLKALEEQE